MRLIESKSIRAVGVIVSAGLIVVCFAAGLIDHAKNAVLRFEARSDARSLSEHLANSNEFLEEAAKGSSPRARVEKLVRHFEEFAPVNMIARYDTHGKSRTLWSTSGHDNINKVDKKKYYAALNGAASAKVSRKGKGDATRVLTDVFLPIRENQVVTGAWQFQMDQTEKAQALKNIFQFLGGMLIGVTCFIAAALGFVFVTRIREEEKVKDRAKFLADHDETTGLYNRKRFDEALENARRALKSNDTSGFAIYWLDIDDFSGLNDTFGRAACDSLIKVMADDIRHATEGYDFLARVGGDQFAIIQPNVGTEADVHEYANKIAAGIGGSRRIENLTIPSTTSVGVKFVTDASLEADEILRTAKLAMHGARANSSSGYCLHTKELEQDLLDKQALESQLREAINDMSQFELHYQPQVRVEDDSLDGYEALIRWRHPERGLVPPSDFIPIAESVGLICDLGRWVVLTACHDAARWTNGTRVAVNISPVQFKHDDVSALIHDALQVSGLDPNRLEIEITESLLMDNPTETLETLIEIKELGVSIAMDDFGTGFSSLKHLWQFPFDKIKIDQSFVRNIDANDKVQSIISSTIQMGRLLGVKITAEGVESAEQAQFLKGVNCDILQGFLYGKAEPLALAHNDMAAAIDTNEDDVNSISVERLREIVRRANRSEDGDYEDASEAKLALNI